MSDDQVIKNAMVESQVLRGHLEAATDDYPDLPEEFYHDCKTPEERAAVRARIRGYVLGQITRHDASDED